MTTAGWLFLGIFWGLLILCTGYCFKLVLGGTEGWSSREGEPEAGQEPAGPPGDQPRG